MSFVQNYEEDAKAHQTAKGWVNQNLAIPIVQLSRSYIRQHSLIRDQQARLRTLAEEAQDLRAIASQLKSENQELRDRVYELEHTSVRFVVGVGGGGGSDARHSAAAVSSGGTGAGGGGGSGGVSRNTPGIDGRLVEEEWVIIPPKYPVPKRVPVAVNEADVTRAIKYALDPGSQSTAPDQQNLAACFLNVIRNHDAIFRTFAKLREQHHLNLTEMGELHKVHSNLRARIQQEEERANRLDREAFELRTKFELNEETLRDRIKRADARANLSEWELSKLRTSQEVVKKITKALQFTSLILEHGRFPDIQPRLILEFDDPTQAKLLWDILRDLAVS